MSAASARDVNRGSNHSCNTASAPASHDAGTPSQYQRISAPAASWSFRRCSRHARPTLSVNDSG